MPQFWRVEGFDGTERIFTSDLSVSLSDGEIQRLLERLVCRHLTPDEILGASLRRNMKGRRPDLEITPIGGKRHGWMTSGNPSYAASLRDRAEG